MAQEKAELINFFLAIIEITIHGIV